MTQEIKESTELRAVEFSLTHNTITKKGKSPAEEANYQVENLAKYINSDVRGKEGSVYSRIKNQEDSLIREENISEHDS